MGISNVLRKILPSSSSLAYNTPAPDWLRYAREATQFTPDYAALQEYQWQNLFVFGQLMRALRYNGFMGESEFRGEAFTKKDYQVFLKDLAQESYPVALSPNPNMRLHERYEEDKLAYYGPTAIRGEVWKVRPHQFLIIDKFLDNTILSQRRRITLQVPSKIVQRIVREPSAKHGAIFYEEQTVTEVRAWAHLADEEFWRPQVADEWMGYGKPPAYLMAPLPVNVPHCKLIPPYYHFNITNLNGK